MYQPTGCMLKLCVGRCVFGKSFGEKVFVDIQLGIEPGLSEV